MYKLASSKDLVHIEVRTSREKEGKGNVKCLAASSVHAQLLCYREV